MSAYRYLLFARHQQPTAEEIAEFEHFAPLLKRRFAIGREPKTEALVFAFEIEIFDQALTADEGFEMLIRKWQVHGCELVDKLKFVKDPGRAASHPRPFAAAAHVAGKDCHRQTVFGSRGHRPFAARRSTHPRAAGVAAACGQAMPYALIALGTVGVIASGFYVSNRIQNSNRERRKETIERVSTDEMSKTVEISRKEPNISE